MLEVEGTERLKATILPATTENTAHTWSSEDSKIASVDETGLITAHSVGTTKIVARLLANNSTAVCEVSVVNKIIHVQSVQLNSKVETLAIGDAVQLTATISPSNATQKNVTWSSQNPDVASVDDNGLVKAVGVGETEIKASADNKTAACKVTVSNRTVTFSDLSCTSDDKSIRVSGEYESIGVKITELGLCWAKGKAPTVEDSHKSIPIKSPFTADIEDLSEKTSYYLRTYAKSGGEVYYSKTIEISTLQTVNIKFYLEDAYFDCYDNINEYSIRISTPILEGYEGGFAACYGVAPHPEITDNLATRKIYSEKSQYELKNLKGNQDYYIRCYTIKDKKPIYYPGEAKFSTIGKDAKLVAKMTSSFSSTTWYYTLEYTLPGNEDIYEVRISSYYSAEMGKTSSDIEHSFLNVKGGTGKLYIKMSPWAYWEQRNGDASVTFLNMTTETTYRIRFGER